MVLVCPTHGAIFSQSNTLQVTTITGISKAASTMSIDVANDGVTGFFCNTSGKGNATAGQTWTVTGSVTLPATIPIYIEYTNPYVTDKFNPTIKQQVNATIAGNARNNFSNNGGTQSCNATGASRTCNINTTSTSGQAYGYANETGSMTLTMPKTPGYNIKSLSLVNPIADFCTYTIRLNGVDQNTYKSSITALGDSSLWSTIYYGGGGCWTPSFAINLADISSNIVTSASLSTKIGSSVTQSAPVVCEVGGSSGLPATMNIGISGGNVDSGINPGNTNGAFQNLGTATALTGMLEWNATTTGLNVFAPVIYGQTYSITPAASSTIQLRASYVKTTGTVKAGTVDSGPLQLNLVYN